MRRSTKHRLQRPCVPRLARARRPAKPGEETHKAGNHRVADGRAAYLGLTAREGRVMDYLAKGLLSKEIADCLNVSYAAVHELQHKIFVKLHVTNRTEAVLTWYSLSRQ